MYDGVPITMPSDVRLEVSMRAMPKSATFSVPDSGRIRFAGLMSRWMTPRSCAKSSASSSWVMIAAICARSKAAPRFKKSRSPVPSTYSMTMNALSSSSPYSYTLTMLGCSSRPAARASFLKRATDCSTISGSTRSLRTVLIATARSMPGSNALYTTPIAPLPSTLSMRYLAMGAGSVMNLPQALAFEHLDRLHHAGLHPPQRLGQNADLVLAAGTKVACIEIAEAYFIGKPRQALDAPGNEPIQHQVEHDDGEDENRPQRYQENLEHVVGTLKRDGGRHRYDLRADYIVYFPAEAVDGAVGFNHRLGCRIRSAVTDEARRILDLDRPCQIHQTAFRRIPLAERLELGGCRAEHVHDVGLPVGRAVARIGRIKRRFLVAVVGILPAHVVEWLGGGERGNRLR